MGIKNYLQEIQKVDKTGPLISDKKCIAVMTRLAERMASISPSWLGFSLPERVKDFPVTMMKKKIAKSDKTCYIEGRQHILLMMV